MPPSEQNIRNQGIPRIVYLDQTHMPPSGQDFLDHQSHKAVNIKYLDIGYLQWINQGWLIVDTTTSRCT